MNNVKIVYYNIETIDNNTFENAIVTNNNTISHITIKPGLMFVNYKGSSKDLYQSLGEVIKDKSILIHDLDSEAQCYYGFMDKDIWQWLANNRM